jgi:outer membrane autotransporter protein
VLPDAPVFAPGAGGGVNSFAAESAASPFDAFASFPQEALGYAATKAPVFKGAAATYADGNAVWAKGFGGQRQQDTVGGFLGGTTTGYGGAVGYERLLNPDLKIGALIGASTNKTNLYLSAGSTNTDTAFGGLYGRYTRGATFLDLAVIGGNLDNTSARNIGGGLALQTANASYGGWFVDPSLMLGHRIDVDGRGFAVTPAVKVRYVAAHFDGYSETGSTANLAVGGRDFQATEERAEFTFANSSTIANGNLLTARVTGGILGQQRSSGGAVNIALLGQNFLAATPDRGSIAGGYGSAGIDWQIGKVTLFAAGEATYSNEVARSIAGKGGVRVGW